MEEARLETATLGGGCFWCLEAVYDAVKGVREVVPGYAGGDRPHPTYEQVCTGRTGHAEVVQITFDPGVISYEEILEIFFAIHDPTTPDRQGDDRGPQYRSIILYHDPRQEQAARAMIETLDAKGVWKDPIVTEVKPLTAFYPAEGYHRDYFARNPFQLYCRLVISPKLASFRRHFASKLRA